MPSKAFNLVGRRIVASAFVGNEGAVLLQESQVVVVEVSMHFIGALHNPYAAHTGHHWHAQGIPNLSPVIVVAKTGVGGRADDVHRVACLGALSNDAVPKLYSNRCLSVDDFRPQGFPIGQIQGGGVGAQQVPGLRHQGLQVAIVVLQVPLRLSPCQLPLFCVLNDRHDVPTVLCF